jgi:hypothetical protein
MAAGKPPVTIPTPRSDHASSVQPIPRSLPDATGDSEQHALELPDFKAVDTADAATGTAAPSDAAAVIEFPGKFRSFKASSRSRPM